MIRLSRKLRKAFSLCLALLMLLCLFPVQALAAENTPKEEVVYVNLSADGSVRD